MNNEKLKLTADSLVAKISNIKPEDLFGGNEKIAEVFITCLLAIGVDEDEIYSFFEEYSNLAEHGKFRLIENKGYGDYPWIFLWKASLKENNSRRGESKFMSELIENIRNAVIYVLDKRMDLLVEDIGRYIKEMSPDFCSMDDYYDAIDPFNPSHIGEDLKYKFYPIKLFEEIKALIPDYLTFEYESSKRSRESTQDSDVQGETVENISDEVWTKKEFYDKWETLVSSNKKYSSYEFAKLITKWGKHLPVKLLKKEIEKKNEECIAGVLQSMNEYAVGTLFAYVCEGLDVAADRHECLYGGYVDDLTNIDYYKLLILLSNHKERDYCDTDSIMNDMGHSLRNLLEDMRNQRGKDLLLDISNMVRGNTVIGEKIKSTLEAAGVDVAPSALLTPNQNRQVDVLIRFWLYEDKKPDLRECLRYSEEYEALRKITLEKPFFFPRFSNENMGMMSDYFYRELTYMDFFSEERDVYLKEELLWRLYWQGLIEKTYKNFEQPDFGKPLFPIILQFEKYLLSRTDYMFSTAVKSRVYSHFESFLLQCRKLQINQLLKSGDLQQEEVDKLMFLAESPNSNYYAWSDEEIKRCLLAGTTDLEKLHANLEPKFMVRIFEKSIFWVIEHRDSELWLGAPWFGMQIFNKSYADRPSLWAGLR